MGRSSCPGNDCFFLSTSGFWSCTVGHVLVSPEGRSVSVTPGYLVHAVGNLPQLDSHSWTPQSPGASHVCHMLWLLTRNHPYPCMTVCNQLLAYSSSSLSAGGLIWPAAVAKQTQCYKRAYTRANAQSGCQHPPHVGRIHDADPAARLLISLCSDMACSATWGSHHGLSC